MQAKQSSDLIKLAIALLDFALISVAFYAAHYLRFGDSKWAPLDDFLWLYYFSAPLILILLWRAGVLTGFRYQALGAILGGALKAFLVAGVLSSTVLYLTQTADYSRLLFVNYFALSALLVLLEKTVVKLLFERYLRQGGMNIRIAMVGFGEKCDAIMAEIRDHPQWGIQPAQVFDPRREQPAAVAAQIRRAVVDEVYVCYPRGPVYHEQIDELLEYLERLGFPVRVALNFDELQEYFGQQVSRLGTRFGVLLSPYNLDPDQLLIKRSMDILGSVAGLLVTLLVAPVIALLIKLESPGPVLFA
ncbi:MAG: hypothetical protein R3228_14030, partial [Halioglobus sp.]|nr:hypothetical protein [Halioglobus sp.]